MSGMLCIGGGVLLCTVFVHMIPEVRENIESARKLGVWGQSHEEHENHGHEHENEHGHGHEDDHHGHDHSDHGYPLAELVVCAGFFIIYFIEASVTKFFGLQGHSHGTPGPTKPKTSMQAENGGIENLGFHDSGMEVSGGPLRSPPDTPNTTGGTLANKTICSPVTSQDNHPDTVDATISPFGTKYR